MDNEVSNFRFNADKEVLQVAAESSLPIRQLFTYLTRLTRDKENERLTGVDENLGLTRADENKRLIRVRENNEKREKQEKSILPFNSLVVTPFISNETNRVIYQVRSSLLLPIDVELAVHESLLAPQLLGHQGYEQYGVRDEFGDVVVDNLAAYTDVMISLGKYCMREEIAARTRIGF